MSHPQRPDLAAWVVRGRVPILSTLLVLTLLVGSQAPSIAVRFAPEELVAPDDRARADADALRAHFGAEGEAIVVLVEADDVLAMPVLSFIHTTALALAADPAVARAIGPTTVPLPRRVMRAEPAEETLEDLPDLPADAPLDALDPLLAPLNEIVLAHPGRWPLGIVSLADEGISVEVAPLVAGSAPTEEERDAIEEAVEGSSLLRGRLVSVSRHVAVLAIVLSPELDETTVARVLALAETAIAEPPPGVRARLTGLPAIRSEMVEALRADQVLLIVLAAIASLLVLMVGLRSVAGVLLPFGTVGITVALTVGGMALFGEPINLLTNMIPPLLLTIGLAEAVHMVLRWEEELGHGLSREEAAIATLRHLGLPCFVTTFTTAIGFGALLLQETAVLRRFGLIAGAASMLAYVVTVTFVPAMLPFMKPRARQKDPSAAKDDLLERVIVHIAHVTSSQWRTTLGVSLVLLLGAGVIAQDIVVDSRLLDQFAEGSEVAETTHLLEAELDGVRSLDIEVSAAPGHFLSPAGLDDLDALAAHLREQPGVLRVTTATEWLREMRSLLLTPVDGGAASDPHARFVSEGEVRAFRSLSENDPGIPSPLRRFVTEDGSSARLEVRLADRGASRILLMLEGVGGVARARGLDIHFSGEAYDASRGLDRIVRSLGSLGAAVALIFLVMTLLFRSVRLGLLSIPPNALPLAMTLAYMVLRGIPLHAATVIVFTVTVGLSVDGATHVIARFQEEAQSGLSAREVVLATVRSSGRGVVLSSATLLLGYGALLFSAFEPVRLFGELSAVAIGGALIAQVVLLPALLAAFAMPKATVLPKPSLEPSA